MPSYGTDDPELHVVDEFEGGVGWQIHPAESLARTSHALQTDDGLWILDPLDAPGVDDLLAEYGDVAGVAICSSWHARDAEVFARRYDVPVSIPTWMQRVPERVEAPIERFSGTLGDSAYELRKSTPLPSWQEAMLYRPSDGTLYVPESIGTAELFIVGSETVGVSIYRRLLPPRSELGDLVPTRLLFGHGDGVEDDAGRQLADALATARKRAPRAFLEHTVMAAKTMWESRKH